MTSPLDLPQSLGQMPRPLGERVLVRVLEPQTPPAGTPEFAIAMAHGTLARPARGVVMAVGPGSVVLHDGKRDYIPLDIKPGDEVLLYTHQAVPVQLGEGDDRLDLILIPEGGILVVLSSLEGEPATLPDDE